MTFFRTIILGLEYLLGFLRYPVYIRKIRKQRKDDEVIIILRNHFGEIVYGLTYAKEFKEETGKKICVYCPENFKNFVQKYDFIDRYILYDCTSEITERTIECFPLVRFARKNKEPNDGIISTLPGYCHFKGLTTLEVYRDYVYNVKKDVRMLYPHIETPITSIPNFDKIKDKMIIINPYSISHNYYDKKLFTKLVTILKEKGYIVYTNIVPKLKQKPIEGTLPFDVNAFETYSIVEQIPLFISIRSGIMDFLCSGNGHLFAIYKNVGWWRYYFSLKELSPTNTSEYFCKNNEQGRINTINAILTFLEKIEQTKNKEKKENEC